MPNVYFTLDEANNLIPWLSQVFEAMGPMNLKIKNLSEEISALKQTVHSNGGSNLEDEVLYRQDKIREITEMIKARITELEGHGIIVRSIPQGLVDFPHVLEGREVYLCWIRGETRIGFFHETNTGYADRQAL